MSKIKKSLDFGPTDGTTQSDLPSTSSINDPIVELSDNESTPWWHMEDPRPFADVETSEKMCNTLLMTEDTLKNDPERLTYFTGMCNYHVVKTIVDLIIPHVSINSSLTAFQQFVLTTIKLRFGEQFTALAYRFNISRRTAVRVFYNIIDILYCTLYSCVYWPTRDEMRAQVPLVFKETFGENVVTIIDCFEVFVEKSINPDTLSQTWSSYKHHNTIKYLIGITTSGCISFISDAASGRTSDTHIAQHCGILEKLLPGDIILADRGFRTMDTVSIYMGILMQPTFFRGERQLELQQVEETRNIAHVRTHVERVIGLLQGKYKLLSTVLPMTVLNKAGDEEACTIDKIVKVCCALVNLNKKII